ncbi:MAG: NAD(P)H-binding protein [Dermatophilaceae bacterium]
MSEHRKRTALVTGPSGYIGSRLVPALLDAGWRVVVLARTPARLRRLGWASAVHVVEGDAADGAVLQRAAEGADTAYFLLHSMDGKGDFEQRDRALAQTFAAATEAAGVARVVYLSGLHPEGVELSAHLGSRAEVGRILLDAPVPAAVLQAAVIVGSGSASFEMLRHLTRRLPVMVAPKWLDNRIQPIAIRDVLHCLVAAGDFPPDVNRTFDIGGPDVLTYRQMIQQFAQADGIRPPLVLTVPVLTPWLASHWVGLVTPVPAAIAKPLVGSLVHEVVCAESDIWALVGTPPGGTLGFDAAVLAALQGPEGRPDPGTVDPAHLTSADPDWAGS